MYFRADPFIDMRFVLLQFFRASYFSIKVLSAFLLEMFLLQVECLAWNTTCYWRQRCVIGAELHFMLIRSLRSSVVIPSALIIFFKMLNLFIFFIFRHSIKNKYIVLLLEINDFG